MRSVRAYMETTRRIEVAYLAVMPLAAVYLVGVFLLRAAPPNGADAFTPVVWRLFGKGGLLVLAALLVATTIYLHVRLRNGPFRWSYVVLLLAEGLVLALTMAAVLGLVMRYADPMSAAAGGERFSLAGVLTVSAGAGLWEELLFRAVVFWGLYRVLAAGGPADRVLSFVIALVVSSALFSTCHFLAEEPTWGAFWYRSAAGAFLAVLYAARGLAVCAYCHAAFDAMVFLVLR